MLLSFAQFEREVTGERIRDKIAASKKKGIWMGGQSSLGYDVKDRKLIVNAAEAAIVRMIFRRYLELGSVRALKAALDEEGVVSKQRTAADGSPYGGRSFSRGALYLMLQNRVYCGEIVHKGAAYPGEHAAIVDEDLWSSVQLRLQANGVARREGQATAKSNLLSDLRVRKLVWRQIAFDLGPERLEAWRDRCDAHKNVSADALAMDGLEPKLRFVEPAVHLAGADQASVQIVGPLMIGADEPLRCALFCGANSRAAMPARIVERVDRPVTPPQDDDRIVANLHREIVARSRDLAVMAGKHPVPGEDRLEIETVEIGVGIKFPVEAHAGAPGLQFGQHGVCQVGGSL